MTCAYVRKAKDASIAVIRAITTYTYVISAARFSAIQRNAVWVTAKNMNASFTNVQQKVIEVKTNDTRI